MNLINENIKLYLNEVNIYNQIGKTIYDIHILPKMNFNIVFPVFFMLKKLLNIYKNFI